MLSNDGAFISAKLDLAFDEKLLLRDLETAKKHFSTHAQVGPYHDGSWRGITLRAFKGNLKPFSVIYQGEGEDTEVMQYCPYFKEVFDSFPCPINTARLLFLPPGKVIGKHRDHFSIKTGLVRLHAPIVTHENVDFRIADQIMQWRAGELWFGNFAEVHSVKNNSDITRVHLVLDCTVTEGLLEHFPKNFLEAYRGEIRIPLEKIQQDADDSESEKLNGFFKLPKGIIKPHLPLIGKVANQNDCLEIQLIGLPVKQSFIPVAENSYAFIDFELIPDAKNMTFELRNPNRVFNAQFNLVPRLSLFEKVQASIQWLIGNSLYLGFRLGVSLSHAFRKIVRPKS